jgi:hypothetical protein
LSNAKGRSNDKQSRQNTLTLTAWISVLFFIILYVLYYLTNGANPAAVKLDPTLVFIALLPFLVWLVVSGRIKELKGPGGLDVILQDAGNDRIPTEAGPLPVEPSVTVDKGPVADLETIGRVSPTSLCFQLGKNDYSNQIISKYLDTLESNPKFNTIIFTDKTNKLKGMMKARDFRALHKAPGRNTARRIATAEILQAPGVITNSIREDSTNKEALEQMDRTGTDVLPVVDAQGKYAGYVRKDKILGSIISRVLARQ